MHTQNRLKHELRHLEHITQRAKKDIDSAPAGSLSPSKSHGTLQLRAIAEDGSIHYLRKNDPLIAKLAQKQYAEKIFAEAQREATQIRRLLKLHPSKPDTAGSQLIPNKPTLSLVLAAGLRPLQTQPTPSFTNLKNIYLNLPYYKQQLVDPYIIPDNRYVEMWQDEPFERSISAEGCNFTTAREERVRSKSEVIIANRLHELGIPYRYEQPVLIGRTGPIHPDFVILDLQTRKEYIWEHFGLMDSPEYCEKALKKLALYSTAGIAPGNGLIVTFESATTPLDTSMVNRVLDTIKE